MVYHVYIITNKFRGTLYIGVTSNLIKRIYEHKSKLMKGFSEKYKLSKLVYIEEYNAPREAITREKSLKNWHRDWKINLIEASNPEWQDLYEGLF